MKIEFGNAIARIGFLAVVLSGCIPQKTLKTENKSLPETYGRAVSEEASDTLNNGWTTWKDYFHDPYLVALIDTALVRNRALSIARQEVEMRGNEVLIRKGEYLPFVRLEAIAGLDKPGRYTSQGAVEEALDIAPGQPMPEPLTQLGLAAMSDWEVDIWKRLRKSKRSAALRYLAGEEGRNYAITELIADLANSYYELLALDNQLTLIRQNKVLQSDALHLVEMQRQAARVTSLAVQRFQAQLYRTSAMEFTLRAEILQTENHINAILGRFPQIIPRNPEVFYSTSTDPLETGVPKQLLFNRPDIRQAELELRASKLDVESTRARFYPSLKITAGLGLEAFNSQHLIKTPESMLYNLAGGLTAPLINRRAIKAEYLNAGSRQIQAVYEYEQSLLDAYIEVYNGMNRLALLSDQLTDRQAQVKALTESIDIAQSLFKSARADYVEVLLTQREALEASMDLIETQKEVLKTRVFLYQSLGGGWR
ncbi:TolC family protein [bacterium]|nr:TolC family protein [bacterium]